MPLASATTDPQGAPLPPDIQKALAKVTEISSLPEITTRIVQVVEDPRATAHDMHEIVKNDPALAAKVLKVVNSAFYGLPSQIASLDRAILMLGLSAVKNIALAASLSRMFRAETISEEFEARDLWWHCVAVGVCAKLIASAGKAVEDDEAFVAGLVHDLGLFVGAQVFPKKVAIVMKRICAETGENFCEVEEEVIGANHQAIGSALANKWRFPPALRYAIGYHHDPSPLKPEFRKIATVIHVADTICCEARVGVWVTAQSQQLPEELLAFIGMNEEKLDQVREGLPEKIEEAKQIFAES